MNIFDGYEYFNFNFMIQIPYTTHGCPIAINISASDAYRLVVVEKTHKVVEIDTLSLYLITPIVPAETNVIFQVGEEPL